MAARQRVSGVNNHSQLTLHLMVNLLRPVPFPRKRTQDLRRQNLFKNKVSRIKSKPDPLVFTVCLQADDAAAGVRLHGAEDHSSGGAAEIFGSADRPGASLQRVSPARRRHK